MAVISVADVQTWLETTKLQLSVLPADLDTVAESQVFARLSEQYDVSGWTNSSTTPTLVKEIVAMTVAAWFYLRQYSENAEEANWYATWLLAQAEKLMVNITGGTIILPGGSGGPTIPTDAPVFWPTDNTEILDPDSAAKFTVAMRF